MPKDSDFLPFELTWIISSARERTFKYWFFGILKYEFMWTVEENPSHRERKTNRLGEIICSAFVVVNSHGVGGHSSGGFRGSQISHATNVKLSHFPELSQIFTQCAISCYLVFSINILKNIRCYVINLYQVEKHSSYTNSCSAHYLLSLR